MPIRQFLYRRAQGSLSDAAV